MTDDSRLPPDEPTQPGTLTALIEDVVRDSHAGAEPRDEPPRPGEVIGRYELVREVGRGGFGVVWEARDRDLGRTVALKLLRVRAEAVPEKRLLSEAEVAARLSHPNIVTVLDVGRSAHGVYLVQEYLAGETLAARIAGGRLSLRESLRIAVEIARGLAHAHAHGVVHRDLKPQNVFLCEDGQVKILDLGMASALGRRKLDGGSPDYMAPEQARAAPEDERTDVFALGVLLYRMLAGASPFPDGRAAGQRVARGLQVKEAPELGSLVEAMLSVDPTHRPRDAGEVLQDLQAIASALPRASESRPSHARVRAPPRTRWLAAGAAAGLALAGAAAAPLFTWRWAGRPPPPQAAVFAASTASTTCTWKQVAWHLLNRVPDGAVIRNGKLGGQGAATAEGRTAWVQRSDWNELFVPFGDAEPDFFAVQADFFLPPVSTWTRGVDLVVFTDPAGPDEADVRHGRGISIYQDPGRGPMFEWGVSHGVNSVVVEYKGTLPAAVTGSWRKLRIRGLAIAVLAARPPGRRGAAHRRRRVRPRGSPRASRLVPREPEPRGRPLVEPRHLRGRGRLPVARAPFRITRLPVSFGFFAVGPRSSRPSAIDVPSHPVRFRRLARLPFTGCAPLPGEDGDFGSSCKRGPPAANRARPRPGLALRASRLARRSVSVGWRASRSS